MGSTRVGGPGNTGWVTAEIKENWRGKRSHLATQCGYSQISTRAQVGDWEAGWYQRRNRRERTENNQRG